MIKDNAITRELITKKNIRLYRRHRRN